MVQHVGGETLRNDDAEATRIVTLLFAAYAGAQFATNMFWVPFWSLASILTHKYPKCLDGKSKPAAKPATADEQSPLLASAPSEATAVKETGPAWTDILTAPVIQIVLSYLFMALHTICFDRILPVLLVSRPAPLAPAIPPQRIRLSLLLYPLTHFTPPYPALPTASSSLSWVRTLGVAAVMCAKNLATVFSFNESAILLNVYAPPGARTPGLVNGVAQTAAVGARMGFALGWFFLGLIAVAGAVQGFWVVDNASDEDEDED
ncbi:hypothetical protein Hte_005987 [Hypoxylon texense]